ncbi:MAG: hypothetical protein V4690_01700 [Patescibacteria group bacterium]
MLKVRVQGSDFLQFAARIHREALEAAEIVKKEMAKKGIESNCGVHHMYVTDRPLDGRRHYHRISAYDRSFIGRVEKDLGDWSRYQNNAHEKALRLMWKHKTHGHLTSRQSANRDAGEYAGAIIIPGVDHPVLGDNLTFLSSFSGFPEDYDEMFCYVHAELLELRTSSETNKTVLDLASRANANWPFMLIRGMAN